MRKAVLPLTVFILAALALVAGLAPLQAQNAPGSTAVPADLEVIAPGLKNPRGLVFGPDGALYIAEAGVGGNGACVTGPEGEVCYGESGAVTKVTFDAAGMPSSQEQIATGFSSLGAQGSGDGATGPQDVAFDGAGNLYVLVGLGADPAVRGPGGPFGADGINFGQLALVDDQGNWSNVVDVAAHEAAENPDGGIVDSNPFGMIAAADSFLVADAGGNTLLDVGGLGDETRAAAAATIDTVAVFPPRMVEFPPGSGQMMPMDAVPTAVEIGPDGAYYVSELTGFPYPVGGAGIWRVMPGEQPQEFATGFTNILDLAFGPDGSLFVLEMAKDSLLVDPPIGRITQITPYGARTVIAADGLVAPVDMEIGPDYALYVANFGPVAALGQVVRIALPQSTAVLPAAQDNTLYQNEAGALSNGQGQHFFAGRTALKQEGLIRRGLIGFDLSGLPAGAMITGATVELHMSKSIAGATDVALHAVSTAWGEGASDAAGEEGAGAAAAPGDATWLHSSYDSAFWTAPGGDFAAAPSATTSVGGVGDYAWSSAGLVADVQACAGGATLCSWLVMGDEAQDSTAKRFDTRENPEEANRPRLTVSYITPLPDYAVFLPAVFDTD